MAKFELKFLDFYEDKDYITVFKKPKEHEIDTDLISIEGISLGDSFYIELDKSTAIKFAKTLRTEINKITESEVTNG
jgi:hypothetical protein